MFTPQALEDLFFSLALDGGITVMTGEAKFEDKTRELSTVAEIQESIDAVSKEMLKGLVHLPPTLALQMAAIHRQLKELLVLRQLIDKRRAEKAAVGKEYSRQEEIDKAIEQGKAKRHRELGSEGRSG